MAKLQSFARDKTSTALAMRPSKSSKTNLCSVFMVALVFICSATGCVHGPLRLQHIHERPRNRSQPGSLTRKPLSYCDKRWRDSEMVSDLPRGALIAGLSRKGAPLFTETEQLRLKKSRTSLDIYDIKNTTSLTRTLN